LRRGRLRTIVFGVVAAVAAYQLLWYRPISTGSEGCIVQWVVDGDTIHCANGEKVRLLRIDTPETDEQFYREATSALKELLPKGSAVRLELEGRRKDRYGRTLAYVFRGSKNVCLEMVSQGWSKYDTTFGYGKYRRDFETADRSASRAGLGVWATSRIDSGLP